MTDTRGFFIEKDQVVNVPQPQGSDRHKGAFVGTVVDVLEDRGTIMVEDNCSEVYEIEADRVKIMS